MTLLKLITPFRQKLDHCLSLGNAPSQGLVYALDADIVLKLPFQYSIPNDLDDEAEFYLEHALQSFVAMEKEMTVYDALAQRPHANIVRRLKVNSSKCLFLERLKPLKMAWAGSNERTRHRWVRELVDALAWLEELGYTHGDLAIRNLGVDSSNCLKIFDFGSATSNVHCDYTIDVKRDYSALATCLHFILSGVDLFSNLHSAQEVRHVENQLLMGHGTIEPGAEILANIIQASWTEKMATTKFVELKKRVGIIIGEVNYDDISQTSMEHYRRLEARCEEWLKKTIFDERWMNLQDYCAALKTKGYEVDLNIWR